MEVLYNKVIPGCFTNEKKVCTNSFKNRFYINSYKIFPLCSNSSKLVNNFRYQFFVVVLYLMWLMLGVQMAVMMNK